MSALIIEEEHGTYTGTPHPHNGYYAGDFSVAGSGRPVTVYPAWGTAS